MTDYSDPRPFYDRALVHVRALMAAVRPDQLGDPTPCADFDVRTLLSHLLATVDRARVVGAGEPPFSVPSFVTGVADDGWVDAHREATERMWTVWSDDARLDAPVEVPWGHVAGRDALWGYVNETVVHAWDLAVATGQDPEADPDLAEATLAAARRYLPAGPREGFPFDPAVEPAPDAGPTERLANWSGRRSRPALVGS
ncbi:TIGR03086 family metal-binding protein [Pseudonocardia sp.]|uniref:TIGR03086 family metal-binding protein n=1 Tax=Pseudonocardia sp. TaxID=60912 RepID=UPI003D134BBB